MARKAKAKKAPAKRKARAKKQADIQPRNTLPIEKLLEIGNPDNPRQPMKGQKFEALRGLHAKFGSVQDVIVNKRSKAKGWAKGSRPAIVGGHQRIQAAAKEGFVDYPVTYIDVAEADEQELNIGLNNVTGEFEEELLKQMLRRIDDADGDLALTGFDEDELQARLEADGASGGGAGGGGLTDPDALPDNSEKRCKEGDLWLLGDHRLLCGDATSDDDVKTLMNGKKADFVFTDPPYGVNVTGKGGKAIEGDISFTAIPLFFDMMDRVLAEKCWVYVCGGQSNMALYSKMFERYFRELPRLIIWDKGKVAVMRANGYHSCFEIVYYSFRGGSGAWWFSGRTSDEADDIWRQTVEHGESRVHPTQKPVEIPLKAITNTCPEDGIIWEPFAGSGSTLIAAQQAGRSCYAMEISPEYCDVILARWEAFTGEEAVCDGR